MEEVCVVVSPSLSNKSKQLHSSEITTAICELNALNRNGEDVIGACSLSPRGTDISSCTGHNGMSPLLWLNCATPSSRKLRMNANPRYISKVISINPRKIQDTSLRMRPYFIPERSRTKSENAEPSNSFYHDIMTAPSSYKMNNNNPTTSRDTTMMDTSTSFGDCTGQQQHHHFYNNHHYHSNTSFSEYFNGAAGTSATPTLYNNSNTESINSQCNQSMNKTIKMNILKKSKSMENVRQENPDGSQPSHEMEFVSSRIQKLKVQD